MSPNIEVSRPIVVMTVENSMIGRNCGMITCHQIWHHPRAFEPRGLDHLF